VRALVLKDNSVLLVSHAHQDRPPFWCFPGGLVEENEDLLVAVRRELVEETGISVEPLSVVAVQEFRKEKLLEVIFLCSYMSGAVSLGSDPDNSGPPVLVDARWVPIETLGSVQVHPVELIPHLLEYGAEIEAGRFFSVPDKYSMIRRNSTDKVL
jgi:ADP-ribose pyrophosphatase YjhB (NUDIX family)